jgi:NADPH:quinone reductase-like Zn-dependent oxidoreductase
LQDLGKEVARGVLRPHIEDVLPLEECKRAHERLETGSGQGKIVLAVTA